MRRWVVVALGVGIAAAALYALATSRSCAPATEEIDEASRARLEQLLREAAEERERP